MKYIRISLILLAILMSGCLFYVGCGGGGSPGGGLSFFSNVGGGGGATTTPSPTPTGGSKETILATGRSSTYDLAISPPFIYWTEKSGSTDGGVYRVSTSSDGTDPVETVVTGFPQAYSLVIVGTNLYFTERSATAGRIVKVDLTQTTFTAEDYVTGRNLPQWIRYSGGFLYWTEYGQNGNLMRVIEGGAGDQSDKVQGVISGGFFFPFALHLDTPNNWGFVTEIGGNSSRITRVSLVENSSITELFSGNETFYGTSIRYDSVNDKVYWSDFKSNSGVYRVDNNDSNTAAEVIETGFARAFDLFGPSAGSIFFSFNQSHPNNGNIFSDSITSPEGPAQAATSSGSISNPFRFTIDSGNFYWTEYPDFDPTNIDAGGGSQTGRIVKFGT